MTSDLWLCAAGGGSALGLMVLEVFPHAERFRDPKPGGVSHPHPAEQPPRKILNASPEVRLVNKDKKVLGLLFDVKILLRSVFIYSLNDGGGNTFVSYPTVLVLLWENREGSFGEEQSQVSSSNSGIFLKIFSEQTLCTNLSTASGFDLSTPALPLPVFLEFLAQKWGNISLAFY